MNSGRLLRPFDLEDEMIVAVVVDAPDGALRVLAILEVDEGEAARRLRVLVLGEEDAVDLAERLEQLHQVVLRRLLRQVGHADRVVV